MDTDVPAEMSAAKVKSVSKSKQTIISDVSVDDSYAVPRCGSRQVLVRVHAASLNPLDVHCALGHCNLLGAPKPPYVPGMDVCGTVVRVGSACTRIKAGDAVWSAGSVKKQGSFATYVVLNEAWVALKPPGLSFAEAASMPMAALTALQALDVANVSSGHRIVIIGASGGVGTAMIQLAKARGADIEAICSPVNKGLVIGLGAGRHVDYSDTPWWETLRGGDYDAVFDLVGGTDGWRNSSAILRKHGLFIGIAPEHNGAFSVGMMMKMVMTACRRSVGTLFGNPEYKMFLTNFQNVGDIDRLKYLCENNSLKPVIEKTYSLQDVGNAFAHIATGRAKGKIVVTISDALANAH